jgi:hypothetical protein
MGNTKEEGEKHFPKVPSNCEVHFRRKYSPENIVGCIIPRKIYHIIEDRWEIIGYYIEIVKKV